MDTTDGSGDLTLSDLELAVATIQTQSGLVGYRNLLSYTSALGIKIYSPDSFQVASWEKIGAGSYSATYRADVLTEPGTVVAVKQPIASFTREKKAVEDSLQHESLTSIIQELRTLANAKLKDHPNLPRILGVYFQEETEPAGVRPCVLFELAVSDLQQYLSSSEGADVQDADLIRLASNIADGIGALHACGLVHGDLKPDNVLLYQRNELLTAVVADLGTCGVASQTQRTINGSLWYSAPEYHRNSPFSAFVNSPSRDVYNYGLILWSIMTRCKEQPFLTSEQYNLQHSGRAATYLLDRVTGECVIPPFRDAIHNCLRPDPGTRPSIFQVAKGVDPAAEARELQSFSKLVEEQLMTEPTEPRVKALGQIPMPTHLIEKLRVEYADASDTGLAIRSAITLAGLYSGVIGSSIGGPWSAVAKIQWLLKAIEFGSHPAVAAIMMDRDAVGVLEEFGLHITSLTHPSFKSPKITKSVLFRTLQRFAEMPDEESANILVWLGGDLDFERFETALNNRRGIHQETHNEPSPWDRLHQFSRFTANRTADFDLVDSDAYDLSLVKNSSGIERSVFINSLEEFIVIARDRGLHSNDDAIRHLMAAAVFHGSLDIVRYIVNEYEVNPHDAWDDMAYLDLAILFRRRLIVEYLLSIGGTIIKAEGGRPSGLHLANRHEDAAFINLLCQHLSTDGSLSAVLESVPADGPLAGWTVAYTAAACRAWKNLTVLLEHGADPNCPTPDSSSIINLVLTPSSPAAPLSILILLLEKGALLDDKPCYIGSPLQWAVGSSNVQAVYHLLLKGAVVSEAALQDARETVEETVSSQELPILDEDRNRCQGAWENMCRAASIIFDLLTIAREERESWRQDLQTAMETPDEGHMGKLWIADSSPITYFIQVEVPPIA